MCRPEAKEWTCYHHVDERKPGKRLTHMVDIVSFVGTVNKEQICSVKSEQIRSVENG